MKLGHEKDFRSTPDWPYHISCGGVVYRIDENKNAEVLLLHRSSRFNSERGIKGNESWHLPKGTMEHDETVIECAVREVEEEAGVNVEVEAYIGSHTADYMNQGQRFVKSFHYFLMKYLSEHPTGMDYEHESKKWLPFDRARDLLEFDKEVIDKAKEALNKILADG